MIILFDEAERSFESLGLGVLKDATSCTVKEALNGEFELEMTYPISGSLFNQIRIGRIITAKPNPYDVSEPFRIYGITKPINGLVTIYANHISYDTNGILVKALKANGINEVIDRIQNGVLNEETNMVESIVIGNNPFKLKTNISLGTKFETTQPYNLRAVLMGDEKNSLIGVYKGELKFNRYDINILSIRGKNRGTEVCYGHNMTDLKHETSNDLLYNKVYPYYHKEKTSTETKTEDTFTKVYIVGSAKFEENWLSYTENGDPYHPVSDAPVQIASEGDYYDKVYCWDSASQKYEEKIYNESVTLIENVTEPSWMYIDWKFPTVVCRAKVNGYFKKTGDTEWSEKKYVGDEVFSINLTSNLIMSLASNFIVYFSEVLPSESVTNTGEVVSSTLVELDEKVIDINTDDARAMRYDRILQLDLTSEFEEEPTKEKLKQKALEYISENKIGTIKHSTEVSFIDLATTTEQGKYKNFEHVELGDTVKIIYEDLGVNTELRVISVNYNVMLDRYISVSLGEKKDDMSTNTIQNGDSIKSLTNDAGYTNITEVRKLVADTITAEFIQAVNAKLTKAQIQDLSVQRISCPGILEASQYVIDDLVAKMLIADNAKIKETLEAGNIKVTGDVNIKSGSINISNQNGTSFMVDTDGNVTSNSLTITGGQFDINGGTFSVTNKGEITAKAGNIGGCVIRDGSLIVPTANIEGELSAKKIEVKDNNDNIVFEANGETGVVYFKLLDYDSGKNIIDFSFENGKTSGTQIAGFTITDKSIYTGTPNTSGYRLFGIDDDDNMLVLGTKFKVDKDGKVYAVDADINGRVNASEGSFGRAAFDNNGMRAWNPEETKIVFNVSPDADSDDNDSSVVSADSIGWGNAENIPEIYTSDGESGNCSYFAVMNNNGIVIKRRETDVYSSSWTNHILSWTKLARLAENKPLYFMTESLMPFPSNTDIYAYGVYVGVTPTMIGHASYTIDSSTHKLNYVKAVFVTPQGNAIASGVVSSDNLTVTVTNNGTISQRIYYLIIGYKDRL